jgi:hypothetical protein
MKTKEYTPEDRVELTYTKANEWEAWWIGFRQWLGTFPFHGHRENLLSVLVKGFASIEKDDVPVKRIEAGAEIVKELHLMHAHFIPTTSREEIQRGYVGDLWGAEVHKIPGSKGSWKLCFIPDPLYCKNTKA